MMNEYTIYWINSITKEAWRKNTWAFSEENIHQTIFNSYTTYSCQAIYLASDEQPNWADEYTWC